MDFFQFLFISFLFFKIPLKSFEGLLPGNNPELEFQKGDFEKIDFIDIENSDRSNDNNLFDGYDITFILILLSYFKK